jgi:hypothetical protein
MAQWPAIARHAEHIAVLTEKMMGSEHHLSPGRHSAHGA